MNRNIFILRLKECRKRKYRSQAAFAEAYVERFGMIRDPDRKTDNGMFGTVQSWEQGKSTPTAEVLANICELLECDADYLLGRIDERTHILDKMRKYTGLSAEAIERLHYCADQLAKENWWQDEEDNDNHFRSFELFLIDEILTGSKHHRVDASSLSLLYEYVYEDLDESADIDLEDARHIDTLCYSLTQGITAILSENARNHVFPPALGIRVKDNTYQFRLSSRVKDEDGDWETL